MSLLLVNHNYTEQQITASNCKLWFELAICPTTIHYKYKQWGKLTKSDAGIKSAPLLNGKTPPQN